MSPKSWNNLAYISEAVNTWVENNVNETKNIDLFSVLKGDVSYRVKDRVSQLIVLDISLQGVNVLDDEINEYKAKKIAAEMLQDAYIAKWLQISDLNFDNMEVTQNKNTQIRNPEGYKITE